MSQARFPCPCCGYLACPKPIEDPEMSIGVCEVCFWENDSVQLEAPDYEGAANPVCLVKARDNFLKYGASDPGKLPFVRSPRPEEKPN